MPAHPATLKLSPFPNQPSPVGVGVTASLYRHEKHLILDYRVTAPPASLRLPEPAASPQHCDGLWRHTCCEIFIAAVDTPAYFELNFSPGGDWAAYAFSSYRKPAQAVCLGVPPSIETQTEAAGFSLHATLDTSFLPLARVWHVGLSCVIEDTNEQRSYWALKHAGEQPDFHLRESFVLTLTR